MLDNAGGAAKSTDPKTVPTVDLQQIGQPEELVGNLPVVYRGARTPGHLWLLFPVADQRFVVVYRQRRDRLAGVLGDAVRPADEPAVVLHDDVASLDRPPIDIGHTRDRLAGTERVARVDQVLQDAGDGDPGRVVAAHRETERRDRHAGDRFGITVEQVVVAQHVDDALSAGLYRCRIDRHAHAELQRQ